MSTITLMRADTGELEGFTEKDRRAYSKWKRRIEGLQPGELVFFSTWFERSGPYHNRHMRMLRDIFESQEQYADFERFREWTQVGAGHCDLVPGPHGRAVAHAKSVAFHQLDQAEMEDIHRKTKDFLRTERATDFLWGHLTAQQQYEMIETLLASFEGN